MNVNQENTTKTKPWLNLNYGADRHSKKIVTDLTYHNQISEQPGCKSSLFELSNPHNLQGAIFGENKENTKEGWLG